MSKLLQIMIISVLLAYLAHLLSKKSLDTGIYLSKDRSVWGVLTVVMILFAGLRTRYNDTETYIAIYNAISVPINEIFHVDWALGENPGFHIANNILSLFGFSAQSFLLFYAAITIGIYLWFIRKYTVNLWLSVYLFIIIGPYTFAMAAVKQCMAMALCLIGVDCALKKKWSSFAMWVLFASLFHPYALMYFMVPFLMFRPWSGKTYIVLASFVFVGFLLQPLMDTVINITTMLGEGYDASSFAGEGVNPLRLAVILVPTGLSFFLQRHIWMRDDRTQNLFLNLTMINGALMFVALFGTANYFARLANYFIIFQSISLPWLFTYFEDKSKNVISITAIACYFVYCFYESGIRLPFDEYYRSISLQKYFQSLF